MNFLNEFKNALLKIGAFLLGIIALLFTLSFILFYGTKIFSWSFSVESIIGVFLIEVFVRYILLSVVMFIILKLFSTYIKPFRNLKIILPLLCILSVALFLLENPMRKWYTANSLVSDFPNKRYYCAGELGIDTGGRHCYINFGLGNKSAEQVVAIVVSRFESQGYVSQNYIHTGDPLSDNWTSIKDPEVIKRINQGQKIIDVFSYGADDSTKAINGISFRIDPLTKQGSLEL